MMDEIRAAVAQYSDGMLTDKEFLGRVLDRMAKEWTNLGESYGDAEVVAFAELFRKETA